MLLTLFFLRSSIHNSSKAIKGQSLKLSLPYISRTVNKKNVELVEQNRFEVKRVVIFYQEKRDWAFKLEA